MNEALLMLGGVVIGAVAVVLGGGAFWAIPLWQSLYPGLGFGVMIGNLKVGSAFRGMASTIPTWNQVDKKRALIVSIPMLLGTIVGASAISKLDSQWTTYALILAIVVVECSEWLAKHAKKHHFIIGCVLVGMYTGFFGAGVGVLLVALLRIQQPSDDKVAYVKAEARFVEMFMALIAVVAHFAAGNIVNNLWIPWSIGGVIGGYIGGIALNHLGKRSGKTQKAVLRLSYLLALGISIWVADF